ncbi:MAG TPA: peptidoglycan-binding domain-containing protein [Pyrinomonadaceae bacterium]
MKKLMYAIFASMLLGISINAQTTSTVTGSTPTAKTDAKPKRQNFRANKEQITQAQKMLKVAESGKMDVETKAAVKTYQGENGLRKSGSLNRATLEKMNITLTDAQKEIPISASSYVAVKTSAADSTEPKKRGPVFRATKEQIMEVQKMLRGKQMYAGEATGKLDEATREGIRKYQTTNGVKMTGTLNKETLEKMGVALTDRGFARKLA